MSNPFGDDDDDGSNPFFETSKSSDFDSESVFGKGEPEPPKPAKAPSPPPVPEPAPAPHPQQSMIDFSSPAPAPTSTSTSTSAILTGINDLPSYDDSNSKLLLNGADYNFAATSENKADTSSGAAANSNDDVNDSDSSKKAAKKKQKKKVVKKKKKAPVDDETAEDDNDGDGGDDGDDGDDDGKGGRHCLQMFYKISWYKPYFDLDTLDFFKRFAWGCVPNIGFFDKVGRGDFYGPFWITTTLLLFLGIASNFASYIAYSQEKRGDEWNYDFYKLSIGAAVFYGYIIVIPIIFYLILRFFNHAGLSLLKCFCAYGYSLAPYIVLTLFCVAPIEWARWLVTALATVLSTLTLCAAFFGALREDMKKGLPVLIGIGAVHVALGLVYKLYFFAKIKLPPASDEK